MSWKLSNTSLECLEHVLSNGVLPSFQLIDGQKLQAHIHGVTMQLFQEGAFIYTIP